MGEGGPNRELFNAIRGMSQHTPKPDANGHFARGSFRHWFLGKATPESAGQSPRVAAAPQVGFDLLEGLCWTGEPEPVRLMDRYNEVGRSVDALVSSVCPPAF